MKEKQIPATTKSPDDIKVEPLIKQLVKFQNVIAGNTYTTPNLNSCQIRNNMHTT